MVEGRERTRVELGALRIDENARPAGRSPRLWWGIGVAVGVLALAVAILLRGGRAAEVEVAAVQGASAGPGTTLLNASGYITPRRRATVAAKITARVIDVFVDEGVVVSENQILATLDDSDAQRRLLLARTSRDATAAVIANLDVNLANAERELKRQLDLEKEGVASVQALDLARTQAESLRAQIVAAKEQVRAADAQIAVAQQDVENCTVRAPFDGIVVSKDAQRGEMVSPISAGGGFTRTGIATIVDMASLEIEVDVSESYIAKVLPGQKVDAVSGCLSRLAHPLQGAHRDSHRRPPEGDREGADLVRRARPQHSPGHGCEGGVPRRGAGWRQQVGAARGGGKGRRSRRERQTDRLCAKRRSCRTAGGAVGGQRDTNQEILAGLTRATRSS